MPRSVPIEVRLKRYVVENESGCYSWQGAKTAGYGSIRFGERSALAHRVVWELANGPIPDGLEVCHRCDNHECTRLDHLFLGTHKDNMNDRDAKGRVASGERSGTTLHPDRVVRYGSRSHYAKLTDTQVAGISELEGSGLTLKAIGALFGVSQQTVGRIYRGRTWTYPYGEPA